VIVAMRPAVFGFGSPSDLPQAVMERVRLADYLGHESAVGAF